MTKEYRNLEKGELYQYGDEWWYGPEDEWKKIETTNKSIIFLFNETPCCAKRRLVDKGANT